VTEASDYVPIALIRCPTCGGSGLMNARKPTGPYEPIGLKECPLCRGAGAVTQATLARASADE